MRMNIFPHQLADFSMVYILFTGVSSLFPNKHNILGDKIKVNIPVEMLIRHAH